MRILYYAPLDPQGRLGDAAHVRRVCDALEARGHTLRLICTAPPGIRVARQESRESPPASSLASPFASPLASPNAGSAWPEPAWPGPAWPGPRYGIRFVVRRGPRRLGHLFTEAALARVLWEQRRRFGPDLILVRQELFSLAPLIVSGRRVPLLVESNSSLPALVRLSGGSRLRIALVHKAEGWLLRKARRVGVVSERLRAIQIEAHDLDPDRVTVVPNGAWLPTVLPRAEIVRLRHEHGVADDMFLAAFAGNLNAMNDLETVLEALHRRDDSGVRVWLIGEGAARDRLERRIAGLGLAGRVHLLGARAEEEAAQLAQAAQVLVVPYRVSAIVEGGGDPMKALQALACDRPVLVSRLPGLEYLDGIAPSGGKGPGPAESVPAEDPEAWVEAFDRWQRAWRAAGAPLSGWPWPEGRGPGRAYVLAERTWEHTARRWETLFPQNPCRPIV